MNANQHTHGITDPDHSHGVSGFEPAQVLVDGPYMGAHLHSRDPVSEHANCRCSIKGLIVPEVMAAAARDENEYHLTVRLDPASIDALMVEMRKTIAAAFGMKPEQLLGGEPAPVVSHEYRALMTVAAFPNTRE